jgi:hypothetical protein
MVKFHLNKISRIGKPTETKSRLVVVRNWRREMGMMTKIYGNYF